MAGFARHSRSYQVKGEINQSARTPREVFSMSDEVISTVLAVGFLMVLAAWIPLVAMLQRAVDRARRERETISHRES
jgi:hypothetical protein